MGMLIAGNWTEDHAVSNTDPDGRWRRAPAAFRGWLTADGEAGPDGQRGCQAALGRYHLYAAWNCPWAHRALLTRAEKGLTDAISVSFVAPRRTGEGWVFAPTQGYVDDVFAAEALHEIYTRSNPDYTGRVTVPLLWDRQTQTAVSNESADIVRMLNDAFSGLVPETTDLYPQALRSEIDRWNTRIHAGFNNGVYRAGFASSQAAYDEAVADVFDVLDEVEAQLGQTPYLTGEQFTEADLRLFPTLVRFDAAYVQAFKCARNRLVDFPNLWAYARRLYQRPGYAETVKFDIYRQGYNSPNPNRNPHGIVPVAYRSATPEMWAA